MAEKMRLGVVGIGKIARDRHLPAIAASDAFELVATASRGSGVPHVPCYYDIAAMIAAHPELDAVSFCTPPEGRCGQARLALEAGLAVMLEKPPTTTVQAIEMLAQEAAERGVTLFASWHSRSAGGVETARAWLAQRKILAIRILWKEDIRRWHPGQEWILSKTGFGVFDPGINALSILTRLIDAPVDVTAALLDIPQGRASPLKARLGLMAGKAPVYAEFDFLAKDTQMWDIEIETDAGLLHLGNGGATLQLPGEPRVNLESDEYPRLYDRFADLIRTGKSDVDVAPLALVETALQIADRRVSAPFAF